MSYSAWRIAAAVAVVAGLGAAAVFLSRGFGGYSDSSNAPSEGTLVDGSKVPAPVPAVPSAVPAPKLAPEHLEHALASGAHSASTVVVALSAPVNEPAVHYHDLDDALAADIAPLFHAGSLLDGSGITYDDLSSEFAAIVAPKPFR